MALLDDLSGSLFGGFTDSLFNGGETEEERRRRLEKERLAAEEEKLAQAESNPVKQTIEINPVTGERMISISGREQDLTAANPYTPTVTPAGAMPNAPSPTIEPAPTMMPEAPAKPMATLSPQHQALIDSVMPPAGAATPVPPAGVAPVAVPTAATAEQPTPGGPMNQPPIWSDIAGAEVNNGAPTMPRLQQPPAQAQAPVTPAVPTPAMQPPVMAAPPVAAPVNPMPTPAASVANAPAMAVNPAELPPPAVAGSPEALTPTPTVTPQVVTPAPTLMDTVNKEDASPKELATVISTGTPVEAAAAQDRMLRDERNQLNKNEAQSWIQKAYAENDPKAIRKVQREVAADTNEGSWIKALLMSSLGLEAAATAEFAKLGIGSTVQEVTGPNGEQGFVTVNSRGQPIKGYYVDEDGKKTVMDAATMTQLSSGSLKTAQTQAAAAYKETQQSLKKQQEQWLQRGISQEQLVAKGLDDASIERKSNEAGSHILRAAKGGYGNSAFMTSQEPGATATNALYTPQTGYNKNLAVAESGDNPNIGYHDISKSSAFGKYGITKKTYEEIQANDPYFQGKPITSLSIADQDRAANVLKGINSRSLTDLNIPVNDNTLAAAHFLGPKGLQDYMTNGTISAEAAAANGGVEKTKKIVDARLNGNFASASSAAKGSVLDGWENPRQGESVTAFDKRTQWTSDDINSEAQQLIEGKKSLKDITGRDSGTLRHYAGQRARELDPSWSPMDADGRKSAYLKFTNPDSQVSRQIRAHVTASEAIEQVESAFKALQNGNIPLFNKISNEFKEKTGSPLPVNAKTGAILLGPEIIKSIIPNGGGVSERLEAKHLLNINASGAQADAIFEELKKFQGNSLVGIQNDWTKAKLPKGQFREQILGDSPASQDLLDYAEKIKQEGVQRRADQKAGITNPSTGGSPADRARAELEARRNRKPQ